MTKVEIFVKNTGVFESYPISTADYPFYVPPYSTFWIFEKQPEVNDDQG